MSSSLISLPFRLLYLFHAWLFTLDVLLLSRRRARKPVAVGTLAVMLGTLVYVIVTCGNLPRFEVPDLRFAAVPHLERFQQHHHLPAAPLPPSSNCPATAPQRASGEGGYAAGFGGPASSYNNSGSDSIGFTHDTAAGHASVAMGGAAVIGRGDNAASASDHQQHTSGPSAVVSPCVECPNDREWVQEQLASLTERVDLLQARLDKCDCSPRVAAAAGAAGSGALFGGGSSAASSAEDVDAAIRRALRIYDADKTGLADYALEYAGGSVLSSRCSETYDSSLGRYYAFGVVPLWWKRPSPRWAIQPTLAVGECWPFKGSVGYLVLQLSRRIQVEAFTLEHIPAAIAPSGNIDSAPNKFEVYGLDYEGDTVGTLLGSYSYDTAGESLQYFEVQQDRVGDKTFEVVELKILSNHGNIHYTCLYRFRVHGKPARVDQPGPGVW